ncbi:MAG: hypothetical protein E2O38_10435 [Proteobacteria bacterium]|nr:MAG: hypothetical protein E2O38_10435 [Pseudomonadota bacterium]
MRALLESHAEALVKKAVRLALDGDTTALRLCLDRIIPTIKSKDEPIKLDRLTGTLTEQGQTIVRAMGEGTLAPTEAATMLQALAAQGRITELDVLEQRLRTLEEWVHEHQASN